MTSAPARAQELIDVAALEAQIEAADELTELPTEPDWGVQDPLNSLPAVPQDAPEVPPVPATAAEAAPAPQEAAPAPRYQVAEPQYHAEYQPPEAVSPEANPTPPPADQPQPAATGGEPVQITATPAPAPVPAEPIEAPVAASTEAPVATSAPATPTIWIWIWNWTWVQGSDERYRNSSERYQIERLGLDQNLTRIMDKIGSQIPVQIGVQTGRGIADEIVGTTAPESAPIPAMPIAAARTSIPVAEYRTPVAKYRAPVPTRKGEPPTRSVERPTSAPLELARIAPRSSSPQAAPATRKARGGGKPHRVRRVSRPAPTLPLPGERVGDSGAASSASAGFPLRSFAVLIASLVLAALGYGRRLRLPSTRLRGLLGTRTEPPG